MSRRRYLTLSIFADRALLARSAKMLNPRPAEAREVIR